MERREFRVNGVVQGVGFRPFVYGLARRHELAGFVLNDGSGVAIEAEGDAGSLDAFAAALTREAPGLARIESVRMRPLALRGEGEFVIAASAATGRTALVPPDVATCEDCLRELLDPADRRHRYPFTNCTQCGPRFTIVRAVPYDRPNTTMAGFPLCTDCRREYEDPGDRRFHAEPIACPVCGPQLSIPLEQAVELLRQGAIVAVKGLGGFHLACVAGDDEAVGRLRARKQRDQKPFAVMTSAPELLVSLDAAERALLHSPARPIVLARRRPGAEVAAAVAPGTSWLGVMLPYTPLHHLLAADVGAPLVMTSGNRSDEPIAIADDDARERLAGIADAFLGHDRPIHRRCEDSVVRAGFPIRRSRGYAPASLALPVAARAPILAVGAELKSTFCVAREGPRSSRRTWATSTPRRPTRRFARTSSCTWTCWAWLRRPSRATCIPTISRPGGRTTDRPTPCGVQHHHAHAAACLAEHGERGPALAVVFDGTGYGPDGTLWGGEVLRCDLREFERVAHLDPVPLPGGAAAIHEPWRTAAAYLEGAGRPVPFPGWPALAAGAGGERARLVGDGAAVRCRRRGARRARTRDVRGAGRDRARAAGRRRGVRAVSVRCRGGGHRRSRPDPGRARRPCGRPAAATDCGRVPRGRGGRGGRRLRGGRASRSSSCYRAGRSRTSVCCGRCGGGSSSAGSGC